jgi:hypothetical protein
MTMKSAIDSDGTPPVCRRLRSKGAGVVYGDAVTWEAGYATTAIFWCVTTADAIGPDDGFVHPHVCVSGRACFLDLEEGRHVGRPRRR